MQVYDMANKLAKEIKESSEYERYKRLKSNIESDASKKEKIEEFEYLRYNIQVKAMQGNNDSELQEQNKLLQEKYAELIQDEKIKEYFEAEMQFNVMLTDVNKIIAEAVRDVL